MVQRSFHLNILVCFFSCKTKYLLEQGIIMWQAQYTCNKRVPFHLTLTLLHQPESNQQRTIRALLVLYEVQIFQSCVMMNSKPFCCLLLPYLLIIISVLCSFFFPHTTKTTPPSQPWIGYYIILKGISRHLYQRHPELE